MFMYLFGVSVFPEASISLAFKLMREQSVRQLPVVENGKLVGMVLILLSLLS